LEVEDPGAAVGAAVDSVAVAGVGASADLVGAVCQVAAGLAVAGSEDANGSGKDY